MTYPGGGPGGYPGPGPQQPTQVYGPAPTGGGGAKFSTPQILHLVVAGVGLLNFFLGFAKVADFSTNFFEITSALPALFLISGLLSLVVLLPLPDRKPGLAPAAISVAATLTALFALISGSSGVGTILLTIFGFVHSAAAVAAFLMDAGVIKAPQAAPAHPHGGPYGQPGGYNPPSGQFGQPMPQQPGQPGQPQGQQPGQFGPPPGHNQQTTFAPQHGQFGQQAPGTPPGGYPQQQG